MLNENLFENNNEMNSQIEKALVTVLSFSEDNNKILRVDNYNEAGGIEKGLFNEEDIVEVSSVVSHLEDKNVFLLNEEEGKNFYKLIKGVSNMIPKYGKRDSLKSSVTILNGISQDIEEGAQENFNNKSDISLLRSMGQINIFVPADAYEAEYLLKVGENSFFKNIPNRFSYFKLSTHNSYNIFESDHFIKEGSLKEYTGMPEIIHIPKNTKSPFEVAIISCGPIIYNALYAAKELEEKNYKVTVLNFSLISSNSEYINQKIKSFINNFANHNKNILIVEEQSKIGGLGSLISETILENRNEKIIRVERLGVEDDLSPRNIISKAEEISNL
ncbi:MAG: transketolase [Patescibacteria group bacterium]|nr:transketolase [Patescibacteria group bacterium]